MMKNRCCPSEIHERIKRDPSAWSALPYIGGTESENDDGKPVMQEWRNCHCGSTLMIETPIREAA